MRLGGGDVRKGLAMVARAGVLQVSKALASFSSRAGAGELLPSSNWGSWVREKQRVSVGLEGRRKQREKGIRVWSKTVA
jgi:hypothetical protein